MIAAVLLLQAAAAAPTVGDTIWLSRTVEVPDGYTVRAPEDSLGGAVELLGPPLLVRQQGRVFIRYPAVAWEPGRHSVALPGPVLVSPDGVADSTPPLEVSVTVASVLPSVNGDSTLPVQPATGFVERRERTLVPLGLLVLLGAVLLAPLHWWWRRRGPLVPPEPPEPDAAGVPYTRWADSGENRAVLAAAAAVLRTGIASRVPAAHRGLDNTALIAVLADARPDLPLDEIEAVLRRLDATRFAHAAESDVAEVARSAADLAARIAGDTGAESVPEPDQAGVPA